MTPDELRAAVIAAAEQAVGWRDGRLARERARALDLYYARPLGNEVEGRSHVVSTDVADTVEWIMPSLMRIFASGSEIVRFEPVGPEDEAAARQATDYVNHVFQVDNPGFRILYTWFKDALLQRNGILKIWWDAARDVTTERYEGLADQELAILLGDPDVEPVAYTRRPDGGHDVVVRRRRQAGRVRVTPVPPEEFLISREARDLDDARFVGHRVQRTASDLVADGFPRSLVDRLPAGEDWLQNAESVARRRDGDGVWPALDDPADAAGRRITVIEGYLRVDFDGDGISELRQVTVAGNELLVNEPVDMVPFADLTPILMPHTWIGRSIADLVSDIQIIKSIVLRQALDNLYLVNNARIEVVEEQVNLDDLLTARPGGVVRVKQPGAIRPLDVPPVFQSALGMVEYLDSVRENRTGVTRYNQGLHADTLNKTASGINRIMTAAEQRLELVARLFAETGVKRLFRLILRQVAKHQQGARILRLENRWVPMDPRSWNEQMDCTVTVGIGTGSRELTLASTSQLLALIEKIVALQGGVNGPIVGLEQVHNALVQLVEAMGLKGAERFFMDPANRPPPPLPQPPAPSPDKQLDAQVKLAELRVSSEIEQAKLRLAARRAALEEGRIGVEAVQAAHDVRDEQANAAEAKP